MDTATILRPLAALGHATGLTRPTDPRPPRRPAQWRYLIGDRVTLARPRPADLAHRPRPLGRILAVRGPYWQRGYALVGPDWRGVKLPGRREHGDFLGGMSWHRYGPLVVSGHRIRGSWRGDRVSARLAREYREKHGDV